MARVTLKASPEGLHKAKASLRRFASKIALADLARLSRTTVQAFFAGKEISVDSFRQICEALELPWEAISGIKTEALSISPTRVEQPLENKSDSAIVTPHLIPESSNPEFIGREGAIADLNTRIRQGAKVIVIQAPGGVGKTTLAQEFLSFQKFEVLLDLPMAKEEANITPVESVVEEWLKRDFGEEPGRDFGVMLGRLKRQLQTKRVGVLIDNLEPALDGQGKFIAPHRRYVELLRVLADSSVKSLTLITSREPLAEGLSISSYSLPSLGEEAWANFFGSRGIEVEATILKEIHRAYGGNALAMTILCDPIQREGGMGAYWQEHKIEAGLLVELAVENLVKEQFNRLEKISPEAYLLLCRLGCYRYQDIPTVPTEGLLYLLWDVSETQSRHVIKFLQNWSLVECSKGEFWLHPIVRAESINRLRKTEDWRTANLRIADFFSKDKLKIRSLDDGIKVLESFYHYCNILDWENIYKLLEQRIKLGNQSIKLRVQLKNWGYSQYLLDILNKLEGKLSKASDEGQRLATIGVCFYYLYKYNNATKYLEKAKELLKINLDIDYVIDAMVWLGKIHVRLGNFPLAFSYCSQALEKLDNSIEIGERDERNKCKVLNVIGSIYLEIGEYEIAIENFETVIKLSRNCIHPYLGNEADAIAYISYCEFTMGNNDKAISKCQLAISIFNQIEDIVSEFIAWHFICEFYLSKHQYSEAINSLEEMRNLYNRVRIFYPLSKIYWLKTKAIFGLYENNYKKSIDFYKELIEITRQIEAKSDLAEAYYQLALTYQAMGEPEQSQEYFTKAIQLYEEMEAPKQVEKVRRAMIPPSPPTLPGKQSL